MKGKGNSVNYAFRMHDPRVGRFFAVDPLSPNYAHNSPYAFSENVVINAVELEGLEKEYCTLYDNNKLNMSASDRTIFREAQNQAGMWIGIVALDLTITKGRITASMLSQAGQGYVYTALFTDDDPISGALNAVDVFDAVIGGLGDSDPKPMEKMVINMLSSIADVGINGDVATITDGSKSTQKVLIDLTFNTINDQLNLADARYSEIGGKSLELGEEKLKELMETYSPDELGITMTYNRWLVPDPEFEWEESPVENSVSPITTAPVESKPYVQPSNAAGSAPAHNFNGALWLQNNGNN